MHSCPLIPDRLQARWAHSCLQLRAGQTQGAACSKMGRALLPGPGPERSWHNRRRLPRSYLRCGVGFTHTPLLQVCQLGLHWAWHRGRLVGCLHARSSCMVHARLSFRQLRQAGTQQAGVMELLSCTWRVVDHVVIGCDYVRFSRTGMGRAGNRFGQWRSGLPDQHGGWTDVLRPFTCP